MGMWLIVFLSLPSGTAAMDVLETSATLILWVLAFMAICGLIGAYARGQNGNYDKREGY